MKATVYTRYGSPDVLRLIEVEKPQIKDDEILVKIHAAALNAADVHLLRADPFIARFAAGLFKPKIQTLGADIAGKVEAVGKNIKQFRVGDDVFGDLSACGWGGFAEYARARESALALKPANLSYEEAAAVPFAAATALQALRDNGRVQPGHKVLINGAAGGVGTFAVQIAKTFGAEVTAVCGPANVDVMRSLGADHVIDYTKENFTRSGLQYDVILAANGYHPLLHYKRALRPGGVYVSAGGTMPQIFQAILLGPWISMTGSRKLGSMLMQQNQADLIVLKNMVESGKVKPVIDRRYPLSELADAFRYLDIGHARGKVVIAN